jgi:hypothetical protein
MISKAQKVENDDPNWTSTHQHTMHYGWYVDRNTIPLYFYPIANYGC